MLSLALALGLGTELVAGIVHLRRCETLPGLVFTACAGSWSSDAYLVQFHAPQVGADAAAVPGTFLLAWAVSTTSVLLAARRTDLTTTAVFVLLAASSWLASLGAFLGGAARRSARPRATCSSSTPP